MNENQETFSIEQKMKDVDPGTFNNASVSNFDYQDQGINRIQVLINSYLL